MSRRTLRVIYFASIFTFLLAAPHGATHAALSQEDSRLFPETGKTLSGRFLEYWQQHGGLAQQGYPISDLISERSDVDGKMYSVQYFERAVFEMHTENQAPYDVLLSLLGSQRYAEKYGSAGAPNQHVSTDNPLYFAETKHTIGGVFRTYWEAHGGLADQGFPISDEFEEQAADGKSYTVQYFERAVFEYHPENAGTPYEVLLSQLGSNRYRLLYQQRSFPPPVSPELTQAAGRFSDHYFVWTEYDIEPCYDCWAPGPRYTYVPVVTRALDLRSWQTITVSTVPTTELYVAIFGTTAVGVEMTHCPHCDFGRNIISKDLTTGATRTLATAPDGAEIDIYSKAGYGRYFLWEEEGMSERRVLAWDSATGQVEVIFRRADVSSLLWDYLVGANDDYLVFRVLPQDDPEVQALHVYERKTDSLRKIPVQDLSFYAELSGNLLLWSNGPMHLTNLATGDSRVLDEHGGDPGLLQGDFAVWNTKNPASNKKDYTLGMKLQDSRAVKLPDLQLPVAAGDWIFTLVGQVPHTHYAVTSLTREFHEATTFP